MSAEKIIPTEVVYADNCGACGEEYLSIELVPVKLGTLFLSRVKTCVGCLVESPDIYQEYKEAVDLIRQALKNKKAE